MLSLYLCGRSVFKTCLRRVYTTTHTKGVLFHALSSRRVCNTLAIAVFAVAIESNNCGIEMAALEVGTQSV